MHPRLLNTAIAMPPHEASVADMHAVLGDWLTGKPLLRHKAQSVVAHAGVDRRFTVRPTRWYLEHTGVTERGAVYREEMIRLCEHAARQALDGAGVAPREIGLIVSTSCTGLMIPSVEAYLMNRMGFGAHTRRQPLTELGCAAGAAAVAQAADYLRVYRDSAVLVVAAELASLTAQVGDYSMANVISAALFGDGAAATVLAGPDFHAAAWNGHAGPDAGPDPAPRPQVVASRSVLFPDSEDVMGFDQTDGGLRIFLLPKVPRFLRTHLPQHLEPFLAEHGLAVGDLRHVLLHPGGRKVLEGLQQRLGLTEQDTRLSWHVLRHYGNLSSATVLVMLHHFEREAAPRPGDHGLMVAVGPGFSAEMVLLRW